MRSRFRFPVLPWEFFLEGEDYHGGHGLGSLVNLGLRPLLVPHIHISQCTLSGQRNCASWASHPHKSVTLRPQPGGESTKSVRDMWWNKVHHIRPVTNICRQQLICRILSNKGPHIESRSGRGFPHPSRPTVGPTQLPIQQVLGLCWG
jgi:hypothetical protein